MITVAYITARRDPKFDWLLASLNHCGGRENITQLIIVDKYAAAYDDWTQDDVERRRGALMQVAIASNWSDRITYTPPKPNVWSGRHRLTPRDWWAASTFRNTALCLCKNEFIGYLDDRCVVLPTWLDAVMEAKQSNYAVCGTYEKRINMDCSDGKIVFEGKTTTEFAKSGDSIGQDSRFAHSGGNKLLCPGSWMFGCTFGLPVEWMLQVNGFDESWDSVSMEDTHFGQMLENNGYRIYFDPRMKMVEDRTTSDHNMRRESKEKHPHDKNDKTHKLIEKLWKNKRSAHQWDLRAIREEVLKGGNFPVPVVPTEDWFDGQKLSEML
jgi:hypothetical protein